MNYMLIVIGVILGIIIFILSLITGVDYVTWIQGKTKTAPTITFNNFKELYQITPDKWYFKLDRVSYNHEPIEFKSYFDIIKYRRFKKQVEKMKLFLLKTYKRILTIIKRKIFLK